MIAGDAKLNQGEDIMTSDANEKSLSNLLRVWYWWNCETVGLMP